MKRPFDREYMAARSEAMKRDSYRCQMCTSKKKLQTHHIQRYADAPYLRNKVWNLITLCKRCHKSITGSEDCYIKFFHAIVKYNDNNKGH